MWSRTADSFLAASHALAKSLPLTLSALQSGTISWQHALVMVDETATLDSAAPPPWSATSWIRTRRNRPLPPRSGTCPPTRPQRPGTASPLLHGDCRDRQKPGRSPSCARTSAATGSSAHVYNHRRVRAHSAVNGTQAHRRWRRLLLPGAGGPAGRGSTGNRPHQLPAHQGHADPWTTKPTTSLPGATVAPPGYRTWGSRVQSTTDSGIPVAGNPPRPPKTNHQAGLHRAAATTGPSTRTGNHPTGHANQGQSPATRGR